MKNNTLQTGYNGIKIVNSINMTVPKTRTFINKIPLIITAFLGIFGSVFSFLSMFKIKIDTLSVGYFAFLFFAVFSVIFILPKKFHLVCIPLLALYTLLLYKKWTEFVIGYKLLFNQAYHTIYPNAKKYFNIKTSNTEHIELFVAFIIFLLAAIICYCVYIRPNFFLSFITTFPIIETGLYFGKSPSIIYAFMLIIFWIAQVVSSSCGYYQNIKKNHSGFIRKNNSFIAKPGIRFNTVGLTVSVIAVICAIIFALTAILSNLTDYKRSDSVNTLRSDLKLAANEFSIENFEESMEKFSAALGFGKNKFYSHKLGNIDSINFKNTSEITVKTDGKFDDNIYLKGYTGAVYSQDEWQDLPEEVYIEEQELFDGFASERTFPQDMLTNYFLSRYDTTLINMNIKSEYDNEKYNYTPYISVPSGSVSYIYDTSTEFSSKNNYSFKVNQTQINWSNLPDILSGRNYSINDSDIFNDYYGFVSHNYLTLPDTTGLQDLRDKLFVKDLFFTDPVTDIYKRLEDIRDFLDKNAEYSLKPGRTPDSEDFVNYFLLQNHKGYCVHFATAGVVLARMSGIPARYAEGYVLRASDFNENNLNDDGSYTIDIKDSRAHAWAEIYFPNLGWVPFEFTPASAAALEDTQQTTKTSNTNSKTTHTTISKQTKSTISKADSSASDTNKNSTTLTTNGKKSNASKTSSTGTLKYKITGLFIIAVLAVLAIIILKHFITVKQRNDIFNSGTPKIKVTCAYECILRLIEYSGVERNNMQYLEFAEYAENKLPDILNDKFKLVTEIMLKAQMSNTTPTDTEIVTAIDYCKELFSKIYEKNNIFKKLYIKFWKNL